MLTKLVDRDEGASSPRPPLSPPPSVGPLTTGAGYYKQRLRHTFLQARPLRNVAFDMVPPNVLLPQLQPFVFAILIQHMMLALAGVPAQHLALNPCFFSIGEDGQAPANSCGALWHSCGRCRLLSGCRISLSSGGLRPSFRGQDLGGIRLGRMGVGI